MSIKKKEFISSAMKRTSDWIFAQEIPSDVTVHAAGISFSLHKFPLVSKCGHIRKMMSESGDQTELDLPDIPGGAEAFELAAKFCYGINFEISTENIAMLRCISEFLEMTEEYSVGNLVGRTEAYLNEVALKSLASAVSILHSSESLQPLADEVKLMGRCIDTIAYIACKDSQFSSASAAETTGMMMMMEVNNNNNNNIHGPGTGTGSHHLRPPVVDWWAEDLTVLRIDLFQRVIIAMISRGFKQYALGPILMLYAQQSLRGLEFGKARKKIEPRQEHEKRVVLETIVSLLPKERNAMSVSFLSMLLRAAIHLETTVACRLDLERRMGMQMGQAVLDDLLIPSFSFVGDTLFDVDTIQRIMANYLEFEMGGNRLVGDDEYSSSSSPRLSDMEKVGKLMESYLAEIASDRNLPVQKFISLAELIPEQLRITEDGMYRAIDIYLKAHPGLSEMERKKVCGVMDCQKLSREACAHAAQNERLPVQTVVQVLYYEQQRLRDVMNGGGGQSSPTVTVATSLQPVSVLSVSEEEVSNLKRENQDLKFELVKMKMRLKEMEKVNDNRSGMSSPSAGSTMSTADKPPLPPKKSFISSVSRRLGRLVRPDGIGFGGGKGRNKPARDRRHSIS